MRLLSQSSLTGQKVLLRLDLNVPLTSDKPPKIQDDFRLRSSIATINYLLNRDNRVVIIGHLGNPTGPQAAHSLAPVVDRLSELLGQEIAFAPELFSSSTQDQVDNLADGKVIVLENLRFDPGEGANSRTFARRLANYGQVFVNDAFSVCHRSNASTVAITEFLPSYAGLLLEKEAMVLGGLLRHPAQPFVGIIAGAKIADKLPVIKNLIRRVDRLLVGGGVANTFLAAEGLTVRRSLVDKEYLTVAQKLRRLAGEKLILPTDFVWRDGQIMDLGQNSIELFRTHLSHAKTVFWSGSLGVYEQPPYDLASSAIARLLADLPATTIIAGGNTADLVHRLGLANQMSFISTGGGATLSYMAGETLPGLAALG
ncbi:MAG: phosphoglycerate kinase [Patescibacteria group bacterium]